jgi:tight adherence protein B
MNIYVIAVLIFIISIAVIEMLLYALRVAKNPDRAKIRKKLRKMSYDPVLDEDTTDIQRRVVYSEINALNEVLRRITLMEKLNKLLYQSNAKYKAGFYLILSVLIGVSVYLVVNLLGYAYFVSIPAGIAGLVSPFLYLKRKKKKRMAKFMAQLPEALDLVARSMKAGHAFSTGLKLASEEFDDPLGPEFDVALDEINFGVAVPDALRKMTHRVDCPDLNFFVVAVILQRETGGNLAEIIENIASLIRERFVFFGKVRTLAAEGVLSMWVLILLPFGIVGALTVMNPDYIATLFEETLGHIMIGVALFMMLIGYFVMRNICQIKV